MKKKISCLCIAVIFCFFLTGCCTMVNAVLSSMPPAGSYAVSSIGTDDGDVHFYSQITDEIMVINKDRSGTFYYDGTNYDISFKNNSLFVDGEKMYYQFINASNADEAMLILYWASNGTNTIILRPI